MSSKILNGNELLIQGGLEAGFNLYTGYPGSPLADFFNILYKRKNELKEKGIKVVIANSEANAAAMASGAKMAGQNVLIGMKSMGLHVASDALSVGNFANPGAENEKGEKGGVVIAVGDDPWSTSTSTPADSRYLFKHLHIPFLEPSTPQELKDWMAYALKASQKSSVYFGVLLTTYMAEGGGRVEIYEEKRIDDKKIQLDPSTFDLSRNVMVPPNSLGADIEMIKKRFPKVKEAIGELTLDKTFGSQSEIGFISAGSCFEVLKQVLEETELMNHFGLYKVACSFPLNEKPLLDFLKNKKKIIVVEEKRGFLETEIKELLVKNSLSVEVFGKNFKEEEGFPAYGGLSYEIILSKINTLFEIINWRECDYKKKTSSSPGWDLELTLPKRLPTFCPGCPHRETLSLLKEIRSVLKEEELQLISHGDVGCYSLSFLEPFKEMHDLSAMGQGGALGSGTDIFTKNPSVVLMGDSTFFHSGMTSISHSVQLGHNITYILLDNDNTAMTGHQVTPRSGIDVEGSHRPKQSMIQIAHSMKVDHAIEVNPSDRYFYKNLLLDMVKKPGVKVIVSNKECALTFHGRKKSFERKYFASNQVEKKRSFYQINTFSCEDCRECVEMTGCPGLSQTFDSYGSKVQIDPQICVSDSYCTKIKACPSFELVEVSNYHPTKYLTQNIHGQEEALPLPVAKKSLEDIAKGDDFRAVVIGVGGSGVTTISRVLAEASSEMGGRDDLNFKFVDQKGLAQRNGSVTGHLSIFAKNKSHSQTTPLGTADIILSPDLLEGARALAFLKEEGVLIVDAQMQLPLSLLLDRGIEHDPVTEDEIVKKLKQTLSEGLIIQSFKERSFSLFQKSVYSSAMILGAAFQSGELPFTLENLEGAFKRAIPRGEFEKNWKAFQIGRELVLENTKITTGNEEGFLLTKKDYQISVSEAKYPWQRKKSFLKKFNEHFGKLERVLPFVDTLSLSQYLHDLYVFDQGKKFDYYLQDLVQLKSLYPDKRDFLVALRVLTKTYWIKDEVFVAHQLSGHLKRKQDEKLYRQLGTRFKVKHINRPHFDILGFKIEFDIETRDWMLRFFKHGRFLRKLMPTWHSKERHISELIRIELLRKVAHLQPETRYKRLKELDNIKGYREVRYKNAKRFLSEFSI